jgi:signal transduction histidine kinase
LDDLRLKKHSLSQITNDIKSAIDVLSVVLARDGSISADQIVSQRRSICLREFLSGMSKRCGALCDSLDKLTEEYKYETLAPLPLMKAMQIIENECVDEDFHLTISIDKQTFVDQTTSRAIKPIIRIGANDFQSLCRNIIDNAKRHGFKDSPDGATIRVDVSLIQEEQKIALAFRNNGAPFPEGVDLRLFVLRGEQAGSTGNTGTGGYHIKSIMDHVGGRLEIDNSFVDDFPVEIKLLFPISPDETL